VPPTLLVSAIGQIDDVREALTLDLKSAGDALYVLGETGDHCGGSEYYRALGEADGLEPVAGRPAPYVGTHPPTLDPGVTLPLYRALERAIRDGLVRSAATPTKGGLAVSLTRSALAGDLGVDVDLAAVPGTEGLSDDIALFSESNGRFVVSVAPDDARELERRFSSLPCRRIGSVTEERRVLVRRGTIEVLRVDLDRLRHSFEEGLAHA
jgi:phosphoribosylformylglycinamidine synthase